VEAYDPASSAAGMHDDVDRGNIVTGAYQSQSDQ
jgi:hypothetical protein